VNVIDAQEKLLAYQFLRKRISIWDIIQAIHAPVHFNAFMLEGGK
jgi:hypothetical protein